VTSNPNQLDEESAEGAEPWWRSAVFYEIYVRSFSDVDGDGMGDLRGITSRLDYLTWLGVDAIWLTPFYPSPGADHGYDVSNYCDVDPQFGTLDDFDQLVSAAHARGLRVVVDIVPNHTSSAHPWFEEDRARYITAPAAAGVPNNWPSYFGGPGWTLDAERDEYYLHLFAPEQPDLDWHLPRVVESFDAILRFWLDRGVDGFRIDVAHALVKDRDLSDETDLPDPLPFMSDWRRAIDQPEVHAVYRRWRGVLDDYPGDRVLIGEVVLSDQSRVADYLRADELDMAFNFSFLFADWDVQAIRSVIDSSMAALPVVTWVLENHDVTRVVSRIGEPAARAAALLLLALPGPVFLYQGQELGLEEADIPDDQRHDPIFARTGGERLGRDGVRVPLPWSRQRPERSWLPVPEEWATRSVEAQQTEADSFLVLYRNALAERPTGTFRWLRSPPGTLAFERGEMVCAVNISGPPTDLGAFMDAPRVLLSSERLLGSTLPPGTAVWIGKDQVK
jgi:alpha-glucosidase